MPARPDQAQMASIATVGVNLSVIRRIKLVYSKSSSTIAALVFLKVLEARHSKVGLIYHDLGAVLTCAAAAAVRCSCCSQQQSLQCDRVPGTLMSPMTMQNKQWQRLMSTSGPNFHPKKKIQIF